MADSKQRDYKEDYSRSNTENSQPRRTNTPVETTFREFYLERLQKLRMNQSQKLLVIN